MKDLNKDFWLGMPVGMYVILILAFGLLCVSFAIPPVGIISSSSLQGAALILGATWLFYTTTHIPSILSKGAKIKASYGNAQIEIGRKKEEAPIMDKEEEEIDGQNDYTEPWTREGYPRQEEP